MVYEGLLQRMELGGFRAGQSLDGEHLLAVDRAGCEPTGQFRFTIYKNGACPAVASPIAAVLGAS